jgi:hypothetical protein
MKINAKVRTLLCAAILGLICSAGDSVHATTFDTTPFWDGSSTIQPWGPTDTLTYGQTVDVPAGATKLTDFTFYIIADPGTSISAQGEVYNWSGSLLGGNPPQGVSGMALFTSSSFNYIGNGSFQAVTVTIPGGLAVTPGQQIVMDLMALGGTGTTQWGDILFTHVPNNGGGGFNFNNGPSSSPIWDDFTDFGDLAFTANFTMGSVPETANSLLLLGIGLGLLAALKRRFQKA